MIILGILYVHVHEHVNNIIISNIVKSVCNNAGSSDVAALRKDLSYNGLKFCATDSLNTL